MRRLILITLVALCSFTGCLGESEEKKTSAASWRSNGDVIVMDTHTHTVLSTDAALSASDLVAKAVANGCTSLAVTDHGALEARGGTVEYFDAVDQAKSKFPNLILFAGLEWDIPPYAGREHITVILSPELERKLLIPFRDRFEQKEARANDGLRWLTEQAQNLDNVVLIYNHPSRRNQFAEENFNDFQTWNSVKTLLIGFEGGPGHQKHKIPGAYDRKFKTIGRWDPVVAEIGGTWDHLLDVGHNVWGAIAASDYHDERLDYAPCAFSRTHLRVPEKTHSGVLRALRAGSFWADHGRILDNFDFVLESTTLPNAVTPGEVVKLPSNAKPKIRVKIQRGPGSQNLPLTVELIGNGITGIPEIVHKQHLTANENSLEWQAEKLKSGKDEKSAYFRARIVLEKSPDDLLLAYSNPIRLLLSQ